MELLSRLQAGSSTALPQTPQARTIRELYAQAEDLREVEQRARAAEREANRIQEKGVIMILSSQGPLFLKADYDLQNDLSHETALALYELSDNIPSQIHITVPQSASRRHPELKLHTNRLGPHEITSRNGLAVTTVERTLADVIRGGMAEEQVRLAVRQALDRGLVSKRALLNYAKRRGGRMKSIVTASEGKTPYL